MMLAVLFITLGASILLILPETLHLGKNQTLSSTNDFVQTEVFEDEDGSSVDEGALTISKKNWTILHEKLKESRFFFTQLKLLALPITFLVQLLHGNMNQFLLQLASKRLHWSLVDVCITSRAICTGLLYWLGQSYRQASLFPSLQLPISFNWSSYFLLSMSSWPDFTWKPLLRIC